MTEVLLALTFIPSLIIALAWHEAGHLWAAKASGIKVTVFSVGAGRPLLSAYTGRTVYAVNQETRCFSKNQRRPRPGQLAAIHATSLDGTLTAAAITQVNDLRWKNPSRLNPVDPEEQQRRDDIVTTSHQTMLIIGRVKSVEPDGITISDMNWRISWIPIAAYVAMPEDHGRKARTAINNAPWYTKLFILFAGIAANLILPFIAVIIIFLVPQHQNIPDLTVTDVRPGTPAASAGFMPGDHIVAIDDLQFPSHEQLKRAVYTGDPLTFVLRNEDGARRNANVIPDPTTGTIGITLNIPDTGNPPHRRAQTVIHSSYLTTVNIYQALYQVAADAIREERTPDVSGPIGAAHHNAQIVQQTGITGWLLMLSLLSISAGLLNALPILPLDGGRIVLVIIQAVRRGQPIPPKLEYTLTATGITAIVAVGVLLIYKDLLAIL